MKTAMQELIEWINQYQGQMISADQVVLKAHKYLEKEKEQIIEAYEDGKENERESILNIYKYRIAEFYYNQTYNQNK
jgi:hypothetical protein